MLNLIPLTNWRGDFHPWHMEFCLSNGLLMVHQSLLDSYRSFCLVYAAKFTKILAWGLIKFEESDRVGVFVSIYSITRPFRCMNPIEPNREISGVRCHCGGTVYGMWESCDRWIANLSGDATRDFGRNSEMTSDVNVRFWAMVESFWRSFWRKATIIDWEG